MLVPSEDSLVQIGPLKWVRYRKIDGVSAKLVAGNRYELSLIIGDCREVVDPAYDQKIKDWLKESGFPLPFVPEV